MIKIISFSGSLQTLNLSLYLKVINQNPVVCYSTMNLHGSSLELLEELLMFGICKLLLKSACLGVIMQALQQCVVQVVISIYAQEAWITKSSCGINDK